MGKGIPSESLKWCDITRHRQWSISSIVKLLVTYAYFLPFDFDRLGQDKTLRGFYVHLTTIDQFRNHRLTATQWLDNESKRKGVIFVVEHSKIIA